MSNRESKDEWTLKSELGFVLLILFWIACYLSFLIFQFPGYKRFMGRNPRYYAQFAEACNDLYLQTNHVPNKWVKEADGQSSSVPINSKTTQFITYPAPKNYGLLPEYGETSHLIINGNDSFLPLVLRNIHPAYIHINTYQKKKTWDSLGVEVVPGRGGWGIGWHQSGEGSALHWELTTGGGEGGNTVLFSTAPKQEILNSEWVELRLSIFLVSAIFGFLTYIFFRWNPEKSVFYLFVKFMFWLSGLIFINMTIFCYFNSDNWIERNVLVLMGLGILGFSIYRFFSWKPKNKISKWIRSSILLFHGFVFALLFLSRFFYLFGGI